jgi:hypothetical protein
MMKRACQNRRKWFVWLGPILFVLVAILVAHRIHDVRGTQSGGHVLDASVPVAATLAEPSRPVQANDDGAIAVPTAVSGAVSGDVAAPAQASTVVNAKSTHMEGSAARVVDSASLQPLPGFTVQEQRNANEEANTYVLPYAEFKGEPVTSDPDGYEDGNARIRPDESQDILEARVPVVKRVLPNKIRLARINEQRAKQGLPELVAGRDVNVAPLGKELVVEPVAGKERVSGGGDSSDAGGDAPVSGGGDVPAAGGDEPVSGGGELSYVDNSQLKYFPPIGSQYGNQCVSWAEIYYNTTYGVAMMNDWDAKNGGDEYRFSPMHTYNFVNNGNNEYTYYTDALNIAKYNGVVRYNEKSTKNDVRTWNTDSDQYLRALSSRIAGYTYINNLSTTGLQTLKEHLANGHIVTFASYGTTRFSFHTISDDPGTAEDDAFVGQKIAYTMSTGGGHARSIVGYNDHIWHDKNGNSVVDAGEKGALKFADSQGTGYANSGFGWIPYHMVTNYANLDVFWNDRVYVPLFRETAHEPKIVARITINHNRRDQVKVVLGVSDTGSTSPTTLVGSGILSDCINNTAPNYQGGPYSFSGLSPVFEDFTYYLDFDDALPAMGTTTRWYVRATDSTTTADNLTLKAFDLCQVAGTNLNVIASASGLPKTIGNTTSDTYVEWTYGPVIDSDGDGLDDYWEIFYFGNLDQGPDDDPDGDGLTNLEEYYGGTNPLIPETEIKLTGTIIGSPGSYNNDPAMGKDKAFDGDFDSFYHGDLADGNWVGLDLGSPKEITMIKYAARQHWGSRMDGGQFQASSTADFSSDVVTFYTISGWPAYGTLTEQAITMSQTYRYVRYISPDNGWCNVAELEFWGDFAPEAPTGLTATQGGSQIDLDWDDNTELDLASYNVYRSTTSGTYGTALATNVPDSAYSDNTVSSGNTYYYVVEAVDADGNVSAKSAQAYLTFLLNAHAPVVDAGTNQTVELEGDAVVVILDGTVTDADGQTPATLWSQVSGTGTVLFADATAVDTTATIDETGTYVLRLVADDGLYTTTDEMTVTVVRYKPVIASAEGATGITDTSALLRGWLTHTGAAPTTVWCFWNANSDPGPTTSGWGYSNSFGVAVDTGKYTNDTAETAELSPGTLYYYRYMATNTHGAGWSDAQSFTTLKPPAEITLGDLAQTYDGTPRSVTVTTTPPGLAVDVTYNGVSDNPRECGQLYGLGNRQ